MRIGVNTLYLIPGEVGGTEVYLRQVLAAMRRINPADDLVLFTNDENHDSFSEYERIPMRVSASSRSRRILTEQTFLAGTAAQAHIDVLFNPGYTAPLRCPIPQIVTIHDVQYKAFPEDFAWQELHAHRFLVGGAARLSGFVMTDSEFSRAEIRKHLAIPEERIRVAQPGVLLGEKTTLPDGVTSPFLLCVANTYPHKNLPALVEALSSIAGNIPHQLVIVGRARKGEPPPHPRVTRLQRIPEGELWALYGACGAFILPSRYEGFGLPVAEAMAAGARVIAGRAGAVPEVGGDAISYFRALDPGAMAEGILQLLNEPGEVRRQFIDAARQRAQSITWEHCAETILQALRDLRGQTKHP